MLQHSAISLLSKFHFVSKTWCWQIVLGKTQTQWHIGFPDIFDINTGVKYFQSVKTNGVCLSSTNTSHLLVCLQPAKNISIEIIFNRSYSLFSFSTTKNMYIIMYDNIVKFTSHIEQPIYFLWNIYLESFFFFPFIYFTVFTFSF